MLCRILSTKLVFILIDMSQSVQAIDMAIMIVFLSLACCTAAHSEPAWEAEHAQHAGATTNQQCTLHGSWRALNERAQGLRLSGGTCITLHILRTMCLYICRVRGNSLLAGNHVILHV